MPARFLCEQCRALSDRRKPLPAHSGLRPMLDLSGRQLYRCRHCGAFATSPTEGGDEWSFNVHGQVVMPGGDD